YVDGTGETVGWSSGEKMAAEFPSSLDDSSPDALKNTPSNIARLEDIIEQNKARHKYLAHTNSPSDGDDVRWYFCKLPLALNQVAASVPATEIVGEGEYFRFGMRDSLALEASFLQREEECLSAWWKEYAECSEGPGGSGRVSITSHSIEPKSSNVSGQKLERGLDSVHGSGEIYGDAEEPVGVPVKGGLYEVWHRRTFQPSGQFAARVDLQGATQ
ncbi:hypothetical protein KI387_016958, partial [Taxus chinensis]